MNKTQVIFILVLSVITVASLTTAAVLYSKLETLKEQTSSPAQTTTENIQKVVFEVGKYINLPEDETPTMATVADPKALGDQPFFAQAHTGDIVLIYTTSRKAILWRPSTKKIIEVSSINIP